MKEPAVEQGLRVGEYLVGGLIARGGMGAVYAATHPVIGKQAAVKVMHAALTHHPEAMDRFIQEARAVNQIRHPNIVDVFSFGQLDDGRAYMVMELVEGESLADRLERGPLPVDEAASILDRLASAVDAAHQAGVIHRDLKPDNVMLVNPPGGSFTVKLLDFGIAKLAMPDDQGFMGHTQTGLVMGTPFYMSPEQARGKGLDHRTDIYALGCIMFEMLTGRVPFPADNATDAVIQHVQAAIPSVVALRSDLPAEVDGLVASMLAKSAADRPSLAEIRETLRTLGEGASVSRPVTAEAQPTLPAATQAIERGQTGLPWSRIAVVAGIAVGLALGIAFVRTREAPESKTPVVSPEPVRVEAPSPGPEPLPVPAVTADAGVRTMTESAADAAAAPVVDSPAPKRAPRREPTRRPPVATPTTSPPRVIAPARPDPPPEPAVRQGRQPGDVDYTLDPFSR